MMAMRYMLTKLLNIYVLRKLASQLRDSSVTVLAMNPGLCNTGITKGSEFGEMLHLRTEL